MTEHQVSNWASRGSLTSDDPLYLESYWLTPDAGAHQSKPSTIQSMASEVNNDTWIAQFLNQENPFDGDDGETDDISVIESSRLRGHPSTQFISRQPADRLTGQPVELNLEAAQTAESNLEATRSFSFTTHVTGHDPKGDILLDAIEYNGTLRQDFALVNRATIINNEVWTGGDTGGASADLGDHATLGIKQERLTHAGVVTALGNLNLNSIIDEEGGGEVVIDVFFDELVEAIALWERGKNSRLDVQALDVEGNVIGTRVNPGWSSTWDDAGFSLDTTEISQSQQVASTGLDLSDFGVSEPIAGIRVSSQSDYNGPDWKVVGLSASSDPPNPTNSNPDAEPDSYGTDEDTPLVVVVENGVLANDTDADGEDLSTVLADGPNNGTLDLDVDGSFTYTPNENFSGTDSFTYKANDGEADSDAATVEITVAPINDAPTITVPGAQTVETGTDIAVTGIQITDVDAGDGELAITVSTTQGVVSLSALEGLTFTTGDGTEDGTIEFTGTLEAIAQALDSLTYHSLEDFEGQDTITITVDDQGNTGNGEAVVVTQTIPVQVLSTSILTVLPGEHLKLDLDGLFGLENATYAIRNEGLLPTGRLKANNTLEFKPNPNELGTYDFTVIATIDDIQQEKNFQLQVIADDVTTTRISGQVLDTNGAPLVGIPIELGRLQAITDVDGNFTLELPDSSIPTESINIDIPTGDVFFDPFNTGEAEIRLRRTTFDGSTGTSESNPLRHPNLVTSFMDASMVYGSDEERASALRTNDGTGRLKVSDGELLPFNTTEFFPDGTLANSNNSQRDPSELFAAGDVRANENIGLASLHTLLTREHNRLADEILQANPDLSGNEIYNRARKIVAAQIQQITYNEYLPLLIGENAIPTYSGYDSTVDPHISHLFSAAAFRMGHTQAFSEFILVDENGQSSELSARETSFNPDILTQNGIDPILRGLFAQQTQAIDTKVIDELRNFLFGPPGSGGIDLAAVDIQRGRDLGLPDYNQARVDFGLAPVTSFADITPDSDLQAALQTTYGSVDDIDVIVGGLAEDKVSGAIVGELFQAVIADQFIRSRDSDRFWHENGQFTTTELDFIRNTTLADLIERNTNITDLPDQVFSTQQTPVGPGSGGTAAAASITDYATIDGSGNNLADPEQGSTGSLMAVNFTQEYGDGIRIPAGEDRLGAREVSNAIFAQSESIPDPTGATGFMLIWSQFMTHDLTFTPAGSADTLKVYGDALEGDQAYPFVAEKLDLMLGHDVYAGVNNVIDRPIYLPALDTENAIATQVTGGTRFSTSTIPGASVFVETGALEDREGNPFEGTLSITEVPRDFTPAALPDNLLFDMVVTIQPGEMVFTTPAKLTLPNRAGYAPGTIQDLWSIDPISGEFEIVGKMQVSADGSVVNTIEGGIRTSSWHGRATPFSPNGSEPIPAGENGKNQDDKCNDCKEKAQVNSEVELHSGALTETHDLISYESLGMDRRLTLTYDSLRADPRPIVHLGYDNSVDNFNGAEAFRMVGELTIRRGNFEIEIPGFAGGQYGFDGGEHFWRLPNGVSDFDAAIQADLRFQESGLYNYTLSQGFYRFNGEFFSGSSSSSEADFIHVNSRDSAFGAGWGLSGLHGLVENPDGSVLLIDGDGSELLFELSTDANGDYVAPPGDFSTLEKLADGTFRRTTKNQTVYEFNASNQLASMQDRNGNTTQFVYDDADRLIKITDPVGLEIVLRYANGQVASITDPDGRVTQMGYDAVGNLIQITDPDGTFRTFTYDDEHHMTGEMDKRGVSETSIYDFAGRVDKSIRKDRSEVDVNPVQVQGLYRPEETIDPLNAPFVFQLPDEPIGSYVDANGNTTNSELDQAGQRASATDDVGVLSSVLRNDQNLVSISSDAVGNVTQFTYDGNGNLLSTQEFGQAVFWVGESGVWNDPNNWSGGVVPTAEDRVFLDVPEDAVITYTGGSPTVASIFSAEEIVFNAGIRITGDAQFDNGLTLNNGGIQFDGTTIINGGLVMTTPGRFSSIITTGQTYINDGMTINAGAFRAEAETLVSGDSTWTGGTIWGSAGLTNLGTMTISGSDSKILGLLNNEGTVIQGNTSILFNSGGTINNALTGIYEIQGSNLVPNGGLVRSVEFNNFGTFRKTGDTSSVVTINFNNQSSVTGEGGVIEVEAGTLQLSNQGTIDDTTLNVDEEGSLILGGSGFSKLLFTGRIEGDIDGQLQLLGGKAEAAVFDLTGNGLEWIEGNITNRIGGVGSLTNLGLIKLTGETSRTLGATFTNRGTVVQDASFSLSGTINNEATAIHEIRSGNISPAGGSTINNAGTFLKTTESSTFIRSNFNNQGGLIEIQDGTLQFNNQGTIGNTILKVDESGTLVFGDASFGSPRFTGKIEGDIEGLIQLRGIVADNAVFNATGNGIEWIEGTVNGLFGSIGSLINLGLFKITGDASRALGAVLTNYGRVVHESGTVTSGTLNNAAGGIYELQSGTIQRPGTLNNSGTVLKTTDSSFYINNVIFNSGLFESQEGVLAFATNDGQIVARIFNRDGEFRRNGGEIELFNDRFFINDGDGDGLPDNNSDLLPDLTITDSSAPETGVAGSNIDISWTVINQGIASAPNSLWKDAIFISDDEVLDAGDIFVDFKNGMPGLSVSGSYTATQSITIPETIEGEKFLLIATDWTAHNLESDEANNVVAKPLQVTAPTLATPPETPDTGTILPPPPREILRSLNAFPTTQYEYDPIFNQVTRVVDELGHETLFEIDPNTGNTLSITEVVGDVGGDDDVVTRFTYTPQGLVDLQTDALGRVTDYDYDDNGNLSQMTFAVGTADAASQQMEYDLAGNLIASIDENGNRTEFEYDPLNRLTKTIEADPDGDGLLTSPVTTFSYDADGNLVSVIDALGNGQTNAYDELGRMVNTTDALEQTMAYEYDALGNVTSTTDALGRITTNQYDERNRLIQTVDADGGITQYTYDLNNNLIATTDTEGNETEFVYDFRDRLVQTIDALGNTIDYDYDAADNLISQSDQNGNRTTFEYDDLDRQVAMVDAESNRTTFEYDLVGNLIALIDANGNRTSYEYDARDRQTSIIDALGQSTTTTYDAVGNITAITNALGNRTTFGYDGLNRQTRITDALGNIIRTNYDEIGNITAIIDALDNATTYAYDKIYRQTGMTDALGNTTSYVYDDVSNLTAVTNALGNTTTYGYDVLNRQTSMANPLGHLTQMGYDKVGNLTRLTDARGNTTNFGYDELNRQTTVTDALNQVSTTAYDGVGNITAITDPLNHNTTFGYDKINRQTTVTDALNHTTTTTYDGVSNITAVTDALGHATTYSYDALNRQVSMTDAEGGTTTTAYDAVDNVTAITDPVGNATTFGYDALNRVIAETNELNQTRTHSYDAVGNLSETTDRNGRTREFAYDALYRQTQESWLDGSGTSIRDINFTYDAIGQLLTSRDPDSSYSYNYDAANRLTTVSNVGTPGAPEVVLSYTYDENGNMLTTTDTIDGDVAGTTAYAYDVLNRLSQVTQSGNSVAEKRVDMTYDAASRMTGQTRYSDLAGTQLAASTDYTFDAANRLTELSHSQGATDIATYSYSYDAANRITQLTSPDGTSTYDYDNRDQLTDADYDFQIDEGYTYDDNGNRTNPGYQTGPNNQLLNDGTYSYEYDDEGNRTRRTDLATGEVIEYIWDYRNRLDDVITTDSTGTVLSTADYTYDVYDRRITKAVDASGNGTFETEHLVYDGDHIALSFDDTGDLTHRYLYGANIDQILADENAQGEILWPLTDHQGTIRDLIDSTGTVQNHLTYSSFGEITSETNSNVDHRFSYTEREFDEETGQYFYRARYYDAAVGRFISEDPIGFRAGDKNLYRYVFNTPLILSDPSGLSPVQDSLNALWDGISSQTGNLVTQAGLTLDLWYIDKVLKPGVENSKNALATAQSWLTMYTDPRLEKSVRENIRNKMDDWINAQTKLGKAQFAGLGLAALGGLISAYSEYQDAIDCDEDSTAAWLQAGGVGTLQGVLGYNPVNAALLLASGLVDTGTEALGFERLGLHEPINNVGRIGGALLSGDDKAANRLLDRMRSGELGQATRGFTMFGDYIAKNETFTDLLSYLF
ncbi:MAG: exosortase-dependent surface protein XDP2 [Elainellaceae cyanobacterium]